MPLPNFLIVGVPKSGSSSLYYYLSQHPEIYTSPIKEPDFFAFEEGENVKFDGPGDQQYYDKNLVNNLAAYKALFDGVSNQKAIGEASIIYLYSPKAPDRIKQLIPNVKLIVILRNPIDRALSSFAHLRREGREPLADFSAALKEEENRIEAKWEHLWHYTRVGFYYTQLKRYFTTFPADQIAVYLFDEFKAQPLEITQKIFQFLNVDRNFIPDTSLKRNVSGRPKSRTLHTFLKRPSRLKATLRPLFPANLRKSLWMKMMQKNIVPGKARLPEETRKHLTELYRDEIVNLQSLIQRDLSKWLEPESFN